MNQTESQKPLTITISEEVVEHVTRFSENSGKLIFDRNLLEISSSSRTILKDNFDNIFSSDNFLFRIKDDILSAKNLNLKDGENNDFF